MNYYPIIIPTLNRYEHFKRCVESLANNLHANQTELVIGLDFPPNEKYVEGYKKIKAYIPTIKGFAKVTVFEHEKNLGPGDNIICLKNYCKSRYEAFISTEDDNVFSPGFLDYMNKALEHYWDEESILAISGYNFEDAYNQGEYTCYLSYDNCVWGMGFWKHKEDRLKKVLDNYDYFREALKNRRKAKKIIRTYPALYKMLHHMVIRNLRWGDVMRTTINILEGTYQLRPAISLVRNCGFDGSGINCGNKDEYGLSKQVISEAKSFNFGIGVGPAETLINKDALYNHCLSKDITQRQEQLQTIKRIYYYNTNPLYRTYHIIRQKLMIRTRLRNLLKHLK